MFSNLNEKSDPVRCFIDYVLLKQSYNEAFHWDSGMRSRMTEESLNKRKDARIFYSCAEKWKSRGDIVDRIISGLLASEKFYIIDIFDNEYQHFHEERMRRCQAMYLNWVSEIDAIADFARENKITIKDLLSKKKVPLVVKSRKIVGGVSPETLAILHYYFKFADGVNTPDPLWNKSAQRIRFYAGFYQHDSRIERELVKILQACKPTN